MKAHRYPVRVYYEDTDAGGIVYHANYLRFAERGRTEALRDLGVPHAEMSALHGLFFMVRRIKVDYLAPARLDDSLVVETTTLAIGAATVDLRQDVLRDGGGNLGEVQNWTSALSGALFGSGVPRVQKRAVRQDDDFSI